MNGTINDWFANNGDNTHRLNYPLTENSIIFDLGGYKGEWSEKIYNKYNSKIYIFEPIKFLYDIIDEKFKNNDDVKVFNFGLSNKNESLKINFSNDGSSFYTKKNDNYIDCRVVSIVDFIKNESINKIDLIKINIEGDEYPVLESLIENNLIGIFTDIQVQFHDLLPNSIERREKIHKEFMKTHTITYNYEFVWENWKKI